MIRPLHPDDAPSLHALLRERSPLTCDYFAPGASFAHYQAYVNTHVSDHHRLVALDGRRLVGLGVLEQSFRARIAHVGRIRLLLPLKSVESEAAGELLMALIDLADNWLNLGRLEADVPNNIPALVTLFKQSGFQPEGLMRRTLGPKPEFEDEIAFARLRGFEDRQSEKRLSVDWPREAKERRVLARSTIRPMEPKDIESLYEVFRAPENCRTTLQLPSQELWQTRERVLEPPPNMVRLVADFEGRAIGMISLRRRSQPCRAHCAGLGMMVHPDYWGQGIGSRLMEEVLSLATDQLRVNRVELQVHTDNLAGVSLYEKHGFVIEGTKHFHTFGAGGWTDTHFMARIKE